MKNILLPTDFSKNANNAINYAIQLHKNQKVKFVLFHSYLIPDAGNTSLLAIDDVIRKDSLDQLNKLATKLKKSDADLVIEMVVDYNTIASGIASVVEEKKIDLIVMGTQGASGIKEFFIGSNTVDVIDEVKIPVWAIPETAKFEDIKTIVFAADYEKIKVSNTLTYLKQLAQNTKATLKVVHVKLDKDAPPQQSRIDVSHEEAEFFKPLEPDYRVVLSENVEKGIDWYLNKHKETNLVAVINHKRSFLSSLFKKNRAHEIAYHSKLPLLVLPEN